MTFVVFCVLSSFRTSEQQKDPYWFDERHKCWLPVSFQRYPTGVGMSTKQTRVFLPQNDTLLGYHSDCMMFVNTNDIEFFDTNPNKNLRFNVEYYKSLHWYNWDVMLTYTGSLDGTDGNWISNETQQDVFQF